MKPAASWYAVYTKPKWEKKVADLLSRKGITNYCPLNKVLKQWHDRKKWIDEPLFTSYVFVCITAAEQVDVRKTGGVLNFVYWLGKPARIREEEIMSIQEFLDAHKGVQVEKASIRVEDRVQITQGPLSCREGVVLEVHHKTVKVFLPSLGYALVAEVEKAGVELVAAPEVGASTKRA